MLTKDSLLLWKIKTYRLSFREQLRQQELLKKNKTEKRTQENIQYALIALGIVSISVLFFTVKPQPDHQYKSDSIFRSGCFIAGFEFLNLLLHPFFGKITHHTCFNVTGIGLHCGIAGTTAS